MKWAGNAHCLGLYASLCRLRVETGGMLAKARPVLEQRRGYGCGGAAESRELIGESSMRLQLECLDWLRRRSEAASFRLVAIATSAACLRHLSAGHVKS